MPGLFRYNSFEIKLVIDLENSVHRIKLIYISPLRPNKSNEESRNKLQTDGGLFSFPTWA